jgi:hypothetical protein
MMRVDAFANRETAAYYLQEAHNRVHTERKMRVLFLVQDPFVWDKQEPVYDVFAADEAVETIIVLVPTYTATDAAMQKTVGRYDEGYWHFFHDRYPDVYDFTNVLDLRVFAPDYIFLSKPYEALRPLIGTHTRELAKFAKLCYIAYASPGTKNFLDLNARMEDFFSHITFHFCDSEEEKLLMEAVHPLTVSRGVQHFEDLGYPCFECYLDERRTAHSARRILWTPRWTTQERIGGSHFFEYKDLFLEFAEKYGSEELKFAIRPHPLMFDHFVTEGQMTEQDVADYKAQLAAHDIELDEGCNAVDTLFVTDILLSDFSSLNMHFFLLDRPMVYCPCSSELADDFKKILEGSYVAENWGQAEYYLTKLIRGDDPKAQRRREIIDVFRAKHTGAARRIAERLKRDYAESLHPVEVYLPEVERWIFEQKKYLVSLIADWQEGLLAHFCAQEWYEGYLALLQMRVRNENLVWGEEQLLSKLQEWHVAAGAREHRVCLTLAMLLFADPLTLSVPLEIDLWPEGLYADIREVFSRQRRERGIG